ncbi:hypothetical protein STRCI_007080 [Streptomyces cinnabarinus]|uniref:DUF6777 domain-containing protein n=1 Tax=Streptomyces cinnabarinus TaxID=67287 RepID=A0ABY7KLY8_9ACTN|nr:DUF6777 domain-containing protein [Streptomyces cinnabarinus]WAZ25573.1 hypothetical protein STRCI_007080 [Streptomyces cinnabarinus]
MRTPTGILVTACVLTVALLATGCAGDGDRGSAASEELFLQPVAAAGPDPFTDSTATSTATPPPVTRTPQPASGGVRSYSGSTPGLYGGQERVGSCDVHRQIGYLTADAGRGRAFAGAAGISRAGIPDYLRGLAPVVLRADTRVTNHGYRGGGASTYQSVLQAGTAVLVDNHGLPRVRCACGNPLEAPRAMPGNPGAKGGAWSGYRPERVVVVTPAPRIIAHITIINVVTNAWIERRIWHEVHHDRPVPRPEPLSPTPVPEASLSPLPEHSLSPSDESAEPFDESTDPFDESTDPSDERTGSTDTPLAPTLTPEDTGDTGTVPTVPDFDTTVPEEPETFPDSPDEIGPESVPETPDLPDGGGLIPDVPEDPSASGSIFGSPTDVFTG